MKKEVVLFILIVCSFFSIGQVQVEWQKCYGGTDGEESKIIKQTTDGGYIIIGDASSVNGDVSGHHGNGDIWIVKTDNMGIIQWQKCYGGTSWEIGYSIDQNSDGGYILTGMTNSNDGDVSGNHGGYDIWVVKIDYQGDIQWQKCLGGSNSEVPQSIINTNDHGYILIGYTYSNNGDVIGYHGDIDIWVVKLSNTGTIQWQKCLGGSDSDTPYAIIQNYSGGYTIAGYTTSIDGDVIGNHGSTDVWVVSIDSSGMLEWQKCLGGSNTDIGYSIVQNLDSSFVIAGYTNSNNGDVYGLIGGNDIWVVKLSNIGNIIWQKCYGGTMHEYAYSIVQTMDGGYLLTGYTNSNNINVIGNHGGFDIWLIKIDSNSNLQWQRCLGGSNDDCGYSIIEVSCGSYILAGWTQSNNGDVAGFHGSRDIWIVKLFAPNLSGKVFHDTNENGIKDFGEQGIMGQIVKLDPGPQYTYTNSEGLFYFLTNPGNLEVSHLPYNLWYETGIGLYNIDLTQGQYIDTLHFGVQNRLNVLDVAINIIGSPTRIGFNTHYWLTYKNWGTVTENGTIEFKYDSALSFIYSSPLTPLSHIGNTLTFAYDTLGPNTQRQIRVEFQVPGVQFLGDTLQSYAMITPITPDTFIVNNYDTLYQEITGSYDPNDKKVVPAGSENSGYIEHGQRLTYTIRFQNTGTDTAFTVIIRDTLDADLDIETFVVEAYSHPVSWQLLSGNEFYFRFHNILLPDSSVNEAESHGFIRYSVSPKNGLIDGTIVTNTSHIFFDYNPAIVTNTVMNTFFTPPVNNCDLLISTNIQHLSVINGSDGAVNLYITGGTPPYSYTINGSPCDSVIYGLSPGTYTLLVYNADTLCLPDTLTFTILQPYDPAGGPVLDTLHNLASECIPFSIEDYHIASVEMTSQGNVIVYWVFQGGGEEMTIEVMYPPVSEAGRYIVSITLNCNGIIQGTYMSYINISSVAMLAERNDINGSVNIYPNPVSDEMYVVCNRYVSESVLRIYTITGTLVKDIKVAPGTGLKVNTAELLPGLYFLQVISADGFSACNRFVKN